MRIVFGTNGLEFGGAQAVVVTLANEFARRSHDVAVWTLSPDADLARLGDLDPTVAVQHLDIDGFDSFSAIRRFRATVRAERPESAMYVCNPVAAGIHALLSPRTRVVYCVHNLVRTRYGRALELGARGVGVRLVALNESCAATVLGGCRTVVPNPTPATQSPAAGPPGWLQGRLLVVGRLIHQKDPDFLLDVMAILDERGLGIELDVIGGRGLFDEVRSSVSQRGLDHVVHLRGTVDSAPWFAERPLFVMTSRWEGQSIALLEAASYGCPIIARDAPGTRDTLGGAYEGLTPFDSPGAMASKIEQWIGEPDVTVQRAQRLQSRMQQEYGLARIADRWEQLLAARHT